MVRITDVLTGQFILACWAVFLVFWFVTSLFVKKTVEKRSVIQKDIALGLVILAILLLVVRLFFPEFLGISLWPYSSTSGVIADGVVGIGLFLLLWSRVFLGRNWSAGLVLKEQHQLIQNGPYAFVRHPIYTGLFLMILGEAIWYGTISWFTLFIAVFIGFWVKAQREEELLTEHFPTEYPAYKKRTKALIPFVL